MKPGTRNSLPAESIQPEVSLREDSSRVFIAPFSTKPIELDGLLVEEVWRRAPVYSMALPSCRLHGGRQMEEGGKVSFAWDAQYFYMGVDLEDSDIVAEGSEDGQLHNSLGDCCELLIKPEDRTWYWELHVTPSGRKTTLFFPGRGRLVLPSCYRRESGLRVAARCEGTLNDWRDRDHGWSAELAMPIAELTARGERFEPGSSWRVLVGRYNYSRYLRTRGPELTSTPQLTEVDFHRFEEYARLELVR